MIKKLQKAVKETGINDVALSGGVSANTKLREAFIVRGQNKTWNIYIPKFSYTTDNAAMIAMNGYYKYLDKDFCPIDKPAFARVSI